jgi:hypothetical protein
VDCQRGPAKKKLSEFTDAELEQMCCEVREVISKLSEMNPALLKPKEQQEREETLQQALEQAQMLELERIGRLVAKLCGKLEQIKAQAAKQEGGSQS